VVAKTVLQTTTYDVRDLLMATRGDVELLLSLIHRVIAPASWQNAGGAGSMVPVASGLQIKQRYDVHREIEKLLASLRQTSRS
jgi:hypothetical protein